MASKTPNIRVVCSRLNTSAGVCCYSYVCVFCCCVYSAGNLWVKSILFYLLVFVYGVVGRLICLAFLFSFVYEVLAWMFHWIFLFLLVYFGHLFFFVCVINGCFVLFLDVLWRTGINFYFTVLFSFFFWIGIDLYSCLSVTEAQRGEILNFVNSE